MPRFDLLNQWANGLDDVPHSKFHMPRWASDDATPESCGTAGCAGGWAATFFQRQGLTLTMKGETIMVKGATYSNIPATVPTFAGLHGEMAIAEFFGIPLEEATFITLHLGDEQEWGHDTDLLPTYVEEYDLASKNDITPQMAADRIRKVITKLGGTVTEDYPSPTKEVAHATF